MPAHPHHSAAEEAKAHAAEAARKEKERQAEAEADAAAEKQKAQAEAAAKESAHAKESAKKAPKAKPEAPAEDPAVAAFRKEFHGVENPDGTTAPEWKPLNWVGGKESDTCTITSVHGTLANEGGTVLTFPRPIAHKLATELAKARPGDRIQVTSK